MSCNGRYTINYNPSTGEIASILERYDAAGVALNPALVLTAPADITAALANLSNPCIDDIDWEESKDLVCVTDDSSGSTPSGSPETWIIKEWFEKNEDPTVAPVLRREQYIDASRAVAFQEDYDEAGASAGVIGTKPTGFTVGACQTSFISVSAC